MDAQIVGSIAILIQLIAVVGCVTFKVTTLSLLPRLMVVIYCMPFIALTGYLSGPDFVWWETPAMQVLCGDLTVMRHVVVAGLVGLLGLIGGVFFFSNKPCKKRVLKRSQSFFDTFQPRVLGLWSFLSLVVLAVCFSAMHARPESILHAGYATSAQGQSAAQSTRFNAAYLISYIIFVLLAIDVERSAINSQQPRLKIRLLAAAVLFVVLFLQILCGDRECLGLLVALGVLLINRSYQNTSFDKAYFLSLIQRSRSRKVFTALSIIVVLFFLIGSIRQELSKSVDAAIMHFHASLDKAYRKNTWTAVVINNAGVADDLLSDNVEYLYGQTYLDYFLSLPPGVLCKAIDVERPIEREKGPVWWYPSISAGGIHIAVVPLKNFGLCGLAVIMFLIGGFLAIVERIGNSSVGFGRYFYGCVITTSFMWFWYGDMVFIRGVMGSMILWCLYQFLSTQQARFQRKGDLGKPKIICSRKISLSEREGLVA